MRYWLLIIFISLYGTELVCQNYYYSLGKFTENESVVRNEAHLILVEDFENSLLDSRPQSGDFYLEAALSESFQQSTQIKSNGTRSGQFQIQKNDPKIWGSTRTEMSQAQWTARPEGWYGFSQYFPDSYTRDTTEEVVGQWHDQSDDGEHVARSPSNALIAGDDRLKWMVRWDADRIMNSGYSDGTEYIDLGPIPKNEWIDWVVHIKFSHTNDGVLEVWKNGEKVIDRQNMPNSYNDQNYPYFKFGVYKWQWGNESSKRMIYYDEVRVGTENSSFNDVVPGS